MWMADVAKVLRERMGEAASKVSTRTIPNTVVRLGAITNAALRSLVPFLGLNMNATGEKAVRLLGWSPRPAEEAIVASAESLLHLGLLEN
jgi:dihydroflavonol-4-reductase